MFTGIIETTAPIIKTVSTANILRVCVTRPRGWKMHKGQSIAVQGICSTVTTYDARSFCVEYMPETLRKTTAGGFVPGSRVHLERPLRLGGSLDGPIVSGHVDAVGKIQKIIMEHDMITLRISIPKREQRLIAPKGSVAIDGVSLTVVDVSASSFTVALIPHTVKTTMLGAYAIGTHVNIEYDMIARYVARICARRS